MLFRIQTTPKEQTKVVRKKEKKRVNNKVIKLDYTKRKGEVCWPRIE